MESDELLKVYFENTHVLQSKPWGQFKSLMGTKAVSAGNAQMTLHKVPLLPLKIGYLPKARPADLDLEKIYEVGKRENCISVKLDVPHTYENFKFQNSNFKLVPGKPVFAQSTVLLDLTKTGDELLSTMHEKTRYNIGLAKRKGVTVKVFENLEQEGAKDALENFVKLQEQTAQRQKFFVHSEHYYRNCFETLSREKMAYLIEARVTSDPFDNTQGHSERSRTNDELQTPAQTAASWMLFKYGDVLYYPYGESNYELRSYMASNLLMWEAIQLGNRLGCKVFDLWGASQNPDDEEDPWYGFTRFKLSFGGLHVKLAPTYDLAINKKIYNLFNLVDKLRWKILKMVR